MPLSCVFVAKFVTHFIGRNHRLAPPPSQPSQRLLRCHDNDVYDVDVNTPIVSKLFLLKLK